MKNFDIDIDFENQIFENIDIDIEQKFDIVPCLLPMGPEYGQYTHKVYPYILFARIRRFFHFSFASLFSCCVHVVCCVTGTCHIA